MRLYPSLSIRYFLKNQFVLLDLVDCSIEITVKIISFDFVFIFCSKSFRLMHISWGMEHGLFINTTAAYYANSERPYLFQHAGGFSSEKAGKKIKEDCFNKAMKF